MDKDYFLDLNLKDKAINTTNIIVNQGDVESVSIHFKIYNGVEEIDYSDISKAIFMSHKPDNTVTESNMTILSNVLTYRLQKKDLNAPGVVTAGVALYDNINNRSTTLYFYYQVVKDILNINAISQDGQFDDFMAVMELIEIAKKQIEDFPNMTILGSFPTVAALENFYPDGSMVDGGFFVKTGATWTDDDPPHYFYWDMKLDKWVDAGTIQGEKGDNGDKGEKGDKGDTGVGVNILGTYPDLNDLEADHPDGSNLDGGFMIDGVFYYWDIGVGGWLPSGSFLTSEQIENLLTDEQIENLLTSEQIENLLTDEQIENLLTSEQIEKLNGIANYNYIINGNFDIWQRGTNFPNATNQYTADRFKLGNIADVSRTTDVPNNLSTYSARIQANSNWLDNPSYFITLLEKPFTGQTVSLSMYIKTDIGYSINISSGGVFLETVNTNGVWKKVEYTFVASSDTAILNILFKPMVAGKGYNIAQVKYELGDQATNFSPRLLAEESIMCQRYYEVKTYIVELPGTPAGDALTHKIGIDCMSKRILPTITQTVGTLINVASLLPFTMGANGVRIDIVPTNMNTHIFAEFTLKIDAEL